MYKRDAIRILSKELSIRSQILNELVHETHDIDAVNTEIDRLRVIKQELDEVNDERI